MNDIITNLQHVHQRIAAACTAAGRDVNDVQLLLATKTVPPERIRVAIAAGEALIGENKVQEFRDKYEALKDLHIERHFIGHLQTNKIKDVLKYVTCIQSLDRLSIAQELDKRLQAEGRSLDVFIQINTSYEESKFGLAPAAVEDFIKSIGTLDTLRIKGLMTIGLLDVEPEKMRPSLQLLRTIREQLGMDHLRLSMGMSQDMELAIAEGANIVRIGSSIFGNRFLGREIWNENETTS